MTIQQAADYLNKEWGESSWTYQRVYGCIYRGKKGTPEKPPKGKIKFTKINGKWHTTEEWLKELKGE